MQDKSFVPFRPGPFWYERTWLTKRASSRKGPSPSRAADRSIREARGVTLFAIAFFSAAAACGAGLGHFHLLYP